MPPQSFDYDANDVISSCQSFKPSVPPCGVLHEAFAHTVEAMPSREFQMALVHAGAGRALSFAELHSASTSLSGSEFGDHSTPGKHRRQCDFEFCFWLLQRRAHSAPAHRCSDQEH